MLLCCRKELKSIRGTMIIRGILLSFNIISRFSIFLSLASYVYFGNVFTARQVFIVTAYFNFLYDSMLHFWPIALTSVAECYVSIKRIEQFLLLPEDKKAAQNKNVSSHAVESAPAYITNTLAGMGKEHRNMAFVPDVLNTGKSVPTYPRFMRNESAATKGVSFKNVTAMWGRESEGTRAGIVDIDIEIEDSGLCAIIGPVGSGKSTILQAILKEIEVDTGELVVNGAVSYAAQEPWLFEGTVRENILFTQKYDATRYKEVIQVCALKRDMQMLPYGDYTIIGERGISLSGGQRARINLARAIYRQADIYLLDDPLSAVDTLVGKHIFDKCIKQFLRNKICFLITHQVQYLKNARHVVLLHAGKIEARGSYSDIHHSHYNSLRRMSSALDEHSTKKAAEVECQETATGQREQDYASQQDSRKETQNIGSVSFNVYKSYFKSVESVLLITVVGILVTLGQIAISSIDLFMSKWVNWETEIGKSYAADDTKNVERTPVENTQSIRQEYVCIYTVLMLLVLYLVFQRALAFFCMCLKASRRIHDKLFRGIIRAKMYFFSTNSSGRIINRFSKDIFDIDQIMPVAMYDSLLVSSIFSQIHKQRNNIPFIKSRSMTNQTDAKIALFPFQFFLQFAAIMILVSITNYWLLLPTAIMTVIFYGLRHIYVNTARCIKRIESLGKYPIPHCNSMTQFAWSLICLLFASLLQHQQDAVQFSPTQMQRSMD